LILLVDLADTALLVEDQIEHLVLAKKDSAKLLFLHEGDGLELDHFEDREEGHDHGVARGAGFEELDEIESVVFAGEDLRAELSDHLRDGEFLVAQLDARDFFAALEDLLEDFYEIDQGDDEVGVGAFVVVEGFVGLGPDVFFNLLFLVEELGGVLEFFVLDEALPTSIAEGRASFAKYPESAKLFLPDGKIPKPGDKFVNKDYAETLRTLAKEGGQSFYHGTIAQKIAICSQPFTVMAKRSLEPPFLKFFWADQRVHEIE